MRWERTREPKGLEPFVRQTCACMAAIGVGAFFVESTSVFIRAFIYVTTHTTSPIVTSNAFAIITTNYVCTLSLDNALVNVRLTLVYVFKFSAIASETTPAFAFKTAFRIEASGMLVTVMSSS